MSQQQTPREFGVNHRSLGDGGESYGVLSLSGALLV
jgi:hypothetical protein